MLCLWFLELLSITFRTLQSRWTLHGAPPPLSQKYSSGVLTVHGRWTVLPVNSSLLSFNSNTWCCSRCGRCRRVSSPWKWQPNLLQSYLNPAVIQHRLFTFLSRKVALLRRYVVGCCMAWVSKMLKTMSSRVYHSFIDQTRGEEGVNYQCPKWLLGSL